MISVIKKIYTNRKHENKHGKEVFNTCYFLKLDLFGKDKLIAIKPLGDDGYADLDFISTKVYDDSLPKENKKDNALIDKNGKEIK